MKNILILAAFMFALASCGQKTEDAKDLKKETIQLNLKTGETYYTRMTSDVKTYESSTGSRTQTTTKIWGDISFKVLGQQNGIYEMAVSYEKVGLEMSSAYMNMVAKSGSNDNIVSILLSNMVNKEFNLKMTKTGKIVEVNNIDTVFSTLFDNVTDIDESQKEQLLLEMKKSYGADGFKGSFEQIMAIYPEKQVKRGDKWNRIVQLESGLSAVHDVTFRFKESDDKTFTINGRGNITSDKNKVVTSGLVQYRYDLSGEVKESFVLDRETGWIKTASITQDISGTMYMTKSSASIKDMEVPMEIHSEIEYK